MDYFYSSSRPLLLVPPPLTPRSHLPADSEIRGGYIGRPYFHGKIAKIQNCITVDNLPNFHTPPLGVEQPEVPSGVLSERAPGDLIGIL